ncbi:MAG: 30S ribosomal protein S12 methylthiotransferase RimO [Oscillospiraceae bacterium]|jgi:ribosomal protein S12 methylthiotransferase|nr:30S ribosomal protein S12 methylthiotransferase RimO [Oscillospiraceae bacterium]
MARIALISLGCAKNLVNSEQMLYLLDEAGFEIVSEPEGADCAIVNTCGFIEAACSEAIETIIGLGELKKAGKLRAIVAAGCMVQRFSQELFSELPELDAVLGTGSYDDIVEAVKSALSGESVTKLGDIDAPVSETGRVISTAPGWAYLRIAEGCDNHCAYCVIPSLRGGYRSRAMENILEEAGALAASGVRELIVIAQDITRYGLDLYKRRALPELLRGLAAIEGIEWIRLHYLYPDEFTQELIELIATEEKIVKYLDIPIQHINDSILKRMNRRGTGEEIRELLRQLRERIPGLVLRTSLIVGLPGEGQAEFEELAEFLRETRLERAGVFVFSPEEGAPASKMTDRCDEREAARRQERLLELQAEIMDAWSRKLIGRTLRVLCEGTDPETGLLIGRSWADSPDVDCLVYFDGEAPAGEFAEVLIGGVENGDLYGKEV